MTGVPADVPADVRVVDLHSGAAWDSVAAAAEALGVGPEVVRAWIADPVKALILVRRWPPPPPSAPAVTPRT